MTPYALDVVCDHGGRPDVTAPPRVVCRALHGPRQGGALSIDGAVVDDGIVDGWRPDEAIPDTQEHSYFGELRRLLADLPPEDAGAILRDPAARDRLLSDRRTGRTMSGDRWRFWCADCDETAPIRAAKLLPALDVLRAHGVRRVTVAQLRRYALT